MKKLFTVFLLTLLTANVYAYDSHYHNEMKLEEPMMHEMMKHSKHQVHQRPHYMPHEALNGKPTLAAEAYAHVNYTMHKNMNIEFTGDVDIDFIRGMIPHHEGAVDMAKVQLEHGLDGTLKGLTRKIIREQEREIRFMKINLATLEAQAKEGLYNQKSVMAFKAVNEEMHKDMNITFSGNADIDFVNGMIPHHQGAVDMAKVLIKHGKDSNNKRLAYDIINAQESEITWMKRWLSRLTLRSVY